MVEVPHECTHIHSSIGNSLETFRALYEFTYEFSMCSLFKQFLFASAHQGFNVYC